MKGLVIASGTSAKGTPWAALASENGGNTIRGVLRSKAAPADRNAKPAAPAVGSVVDVFVEHRPQRVVEATATRPAATYPEITVIYV